MTELVSVKALATNRRGAALTEHIRSAMSFRLRG